MQVTCFVVMQHSILIVEDEYLIALEMQCHLEERGYQVVGIAADLPSAIKYSNQHIDLALVDLNLRDGLTGPEIGRLLAEEHGVTVLFVTANPSFLGSGLAGAVGVLTKPADEDTLCRSVSYALRRQSGEDAEPPSKLHIFG